MVLVISGADGVKIAVLRKGRAIFAFIGPLLTSTVKKEEADNDE